VMAAATTRHTVFAVRIGLASHRSEGHGSADIPMDRTAQAWP